ncbi:kinase-like domain-containing protein [Exophiala viscosa]|uniref:EKC/KEOPS complex subunit BUD32 n=1 Tax=Exophiala viscosa TaxID=2486360 RepID=A0AAN6E6F1_9EURO|nr:kinase-like domain-containing protein [Exophiala viscosa]KAI1628135.1 kinase-like domain-containing protein [Exophiala viscosa]
MARKWTISLGALPTSQGRPQCDVLYHAYTHYILYSDDGRARIYAVLLLLYFKSTTLSKVLACLILFPCLVLTTLRTLRYFEIQCLRKDVLVRFCPLLNARLAWMCRPLTACVAVVSSHTYFLCSQHDDTSYTFQHRLATRLTVTTMFLLHLCGAIAGLLRRALRKYRHVFSIYSWKMQTAMLPRLWLDIGKFYQAVLDFTSVLHGHLEVGQYEPKDLPKILSEIQKHGIVVQYLGQGDLTEVVKVEPQFEKPFARKRLKCSTLDDTEIRPEAEEVIRHEAEIWQYLTQFPHSHFPTLRANHSDDNPPCFDYWPVGSERNLEDWLQHHYDISSPDRVVKTIMLGWFGCVRSIMVHLHEVAHILHCDIRPSNLIIYDNHLYLIDHSKSRVLTEESHYTYDEKIGVTRYSAPEVTSQITKGFPVDVFSFGIIFLYLLVTLCGKDPSVITSEGFKETKYFRHPAKQRYVVEKLLPSLQYDKIQPVCTRADFDALKNVIIQMMQTKPEDRPSASAITLPMACQAYCCSGSHPVLHDKVENTRSSILHDEQAELQTPRDCQLPSLQIPSIVIERQPQISQHRRTLTPSTLVSEPSFQFSQATTDDSALSTASSLGYEDGMPPPPKQDVTATPRKLQAGLQEDLAHTAGPWATQTPDRGVDQTDMKLKRPPFASRRVADALKTIKDADRPFIVHPSKRARELWRQTPVESPKAKYSRRSEQYGPCTPALPADSANPAGLVETPLRTMELDLFEELVLEVGEGEPTFVEGPIRRGLEFAKRASVQEVKFDFSDTLGLVPSRQPTWPPNQPSLNIACT